METWARIALGELSENSSSNKDNKQQREAKIQQFKSLKKAIPLGAVHILHSLRLNADLADTALQKSLGQFCKYCWSNLNSGKIYFFISNTFSMFKFTCFAKKLENALSRP